MAKSLPQGSPPEIPEELQLEIAAEVERRVNLYVSYAERMYQGIPEQVSQRLKSIQIDWANLNFANELDPNTDVGDSEL